MTERRCFYCLDPVDPQSSFVWHRVIGWERKAVAKSRRSGSDIALREPRDEYACNACISRLRGGVPATQNTIF